MATRLRKMRFDEVSFVRRGANQHADVVLFKADGCSHDGASKGAKYCPDCGEKMGGMSKSCDHGNCKEGDKKCPDCGKDMTDDGDGMDEESASENKKEGYVRTSKSGVQASSQFTDQRRKPVLSKSDLPEALHVYFDGDDDAEVDNEEFLKGVFALATDLFAPDDEDEDFADDEDFTTDPLAKAAPEVREIVAKAQAEAEAAIAIAKAEQDRRVTAEFVTKAQDFGNLPVEAGEFGPVLKRLAETNPADYAEITRVLKAANDGMGHLFKATGQDAPSSLDGSSLTAIEKAAQAVRAEQPELTAEQAYDLALRNNPNLYTDALEG